MMATRNTSKRGWHDTYMEQCSLDLIQCVLVECGNWVHCV